MDAELNGHAVGIILKELVRRAMRVIRNERQVFEATAKQGHSGSMDDVFTSADTKAQKVYIKSLRECFPEYAIIAEEGGVGTTVLHPPGPAPSLQSIRSMGRKLLFAANLTGLAQWLRSWTAVR